MLFSKKYLAFLVLPLMLVSFFLLSTKPINAADFHFKGYTLSQDQTVNDDVYVSGDSTQINGVVNGDLFVVSRSGSVSGTITGDLYLIGSDVTFSGTVYGNLFMIGSNVSITGNIKGNLYEVAATSSIDAQAEKDVFQVAGTSTIKGSISDDFRSVASTLSMEALVGGDAITISESESIQKDKVTGNVYDWETIKGIANTQGVTFERPQMSTTEIKAVNTSMKLVWALFSFVGLGLAGYFLITLSPVKTAHLMNKITGSSEDFAKSLCIGLIVMLVVPIPIVLLLLSVFGMYLGLLAIGFLIFMCMFGKVWTEVALGQELLSLFKVKGYRPFKSLLLGRFITVALSFVPLFGAFYSGLLTLASIGAFTRMKWEYLRKR